MSYSIQNRRYTGSKLKLKEWVVTLIKDNCNGSSFCDMFAGTGVIANEMINIYPKVIINDLLYSNNVIYKAFFGKEKFSSEIINAAYKKYESLCFNTKDDYVVNNYGNKYFSINDSMKIGDIRQDIELNKTKLNSREYSILIASLIYSIDKVANTVGHYDAFFQKQQLKDKFKFELIEFPKKNDCNIEIFREDANVLAESLDCDIIYLDPPYNSRQYSRFYHVLENIVEWKKPLLSGIAMKPVAENMSEYCRSNAPKVLNDLVLKLKCKYIIVSYNNTYTSKSNSSRNKITLEEIRNILKKRGKLIEFSKEHQFFNAGKTDFDDHKEYIFIVEVISNETN
ncbi:MAG: DNA adenine methylase [Clostridia bacterium]